MEVPSAENIQTKAVSTPVASRSDARLSRITASTVPRRMFCRSTEILVQAMSTPRVGLPPRADHTPVENTSDAVSHQDFQVLEPLFLDASERNPVTAPTRPTDSNA